MKIQLLAFAVLLAVLSACAQGKSLDSAGPTLVPTGPKVGLAFAPTINGPESSWKYVNLENQKLTYAATLSQIALQAGLNFGVMGSPTKIVKIVHFRMGPSTATSLGVQDITFKTFKGFQAVNDAANIFTSQGYASAADAGASSTAQYVYAFAAVSGPSLISAYGDQQMISFPVGTMTSAGNVLTWDFCRGDICPTIIGNDQIAMMSVGAGGALSGQKCSLEVTWSEE